MPREIAFVSVEFINSVKRQFHDVVSYDDEWHLSSLCCSWRVSMCWCWCALADCRVSFKMTWFFNWKTAISPSAVSFPFFFYFSFAFLFLCTAIVWLLSGSSDAHLFGCCLDPFIAWLVVVFDWASDWVLAMLSLSCLFVLVAIRFRCVHRSLFGYRFLPSLLDGWLLGSLRCPPWYLRFHLFLGLVNMNLNLANRMCYTYK